MTSDLAVPHGYKLAGGTDLVSLAGRLRTALDPVRQRIEIRQVAEFAAKLLDAADLAGTPRPASVIFDAVQAQGEHVGQILSGEHACALTTGSVAVSDDPDTGELYALVFFPDEEYANAFDELEAGEYFPYWDEESLGERRAAGISAAAWERRAGIWERVLRGADPERPHGMFKIEVGSPFPDMSLINHAAEVFAAMPNENQRINHAIHDLSHTQEFATPMDQMAFAASIPAHVERIRALLKPITLEDIAGGAS